MMGRIFDIEEFGVYDGPGIRTVIFLKGCPLRCAWCHNPEGLSFAPQRIVAKGLCLHCGACVAACTSPEKCVGCGACERVCPRGCVRVAGREVSAEEVARRILKNAALLKMNGGGVTFSGGEALSQPDFVLDIRARLSSLHACVETSGYAAPEVFSRVARAMDLVLMDIKLVDVNLHQKWTGVDNAVILRNLAWLRASGIPFRARVPLNPTVNDGIENMRATAELLAGAPNLEKVELLRYNKAAGAKYESAGYVYTPGFPCDIEPEIHTEPFKEAGITCAVH